MAIWEVSVPSESVDSGRVVGNSYLGIASGLPVIREKTISFRCFVCCICNIGML